MQWSEQEWSFCLSCFKQSTSKKEALKKFQAKYPKRTDQAVKRRLQREGILPCTLLKAEPKVTKQQFTAELKRVYKVLGQPFDAQQFDKVSRLGSANVIKCFGSWEHALDQARLAKKFTSMANIKNEKENFDPEKELREQWLIEKEKILLRAEQKKVKQVKEQAQKLDIVNEMLLEAVANVEPLIVEVTSVKNFPKPHYASPNCTLWFEFSDLQLGTLINEEDMGGLNKHDWAIWQNKLNVWKQHVIEKIEQHKKSYKIDRVIIACLGDMVEGVDIFKGQLWKVDAHVVDQAINGANDVAAAFTEIFLTHRNIHFDVLEVFGNHGRIGQKGEHPYACSMDKVFQRMLQSQLERVNLLKNYQYHRNEAWFYFVEVYGWHHLMLHGDQGMSKLWSSRPTINGLEKGLARYTQMFQQQVHFIHCGHFHNDVTWSFNMSQILINGSFVGTSSFSATVMLAASPPIQVMHVFEPRIGLAKTERIYLLEGDIKRSIPPRTIGG